MRDGGEAWIQREMEIGDADECGRFHDWGEMGIYIHEARRAVKHRLSAGYSTNFRPGQLGNDKEMLQES